METLTAPVAPLKGRDSYNPARMNKNITIAFTPPSAEQLEAWMTSTNGSEESLPKPTTTVLFVTMLWLPGSGQCPDNELIRRVCNALQVAMNNQIETTTTMTMKPAQTQLVWIEKVVCSTYKDAPTLVGQLQREALLKQQQHSPTDANAAAPHRVLHHMVIGGHSLGAGTAAKISCQAANATTKTTTGTLPHNKWCVPCIMMGAQPPPTRQRWNTLTILGENDGGSQLLRTLAAAGGKKTAVVGTEATDKVPKTFVISTTKKEAQNPSYCKNESETAEIRVQPTSSATTVFVDTIIVPKDGDHSLRVRAHGNHDKEGASTTRETCAMNLEVADAMLQFMGASHCEL